MIYLMNSAVMPAGCYGTYTYRPATIADLAAVVRGEHGPWLSCMGYAQNCDLVERWTGFRPPMNRIETNFRPGDGAIVMRLRTRMAQPGAKGAPVSEDQKDWEFAWVTFAPITGSV